MTWLEMVSYITIVIGILQAIFIVVDEIRRPQKMMIMNVVWPTMGLYFPLLGFWFYYRIGRTKGSMNMMNMDMQMEAAMDMSMGMQERSDHISHSGHHVRNKRPSWKSVFLSTTHCSGGCALGDFIGAPLVFALGDCSCAVCQCSRTECRNLLVYDAVGHDYGVLHKLSHEFLSGQSGDQTWNVEISFRFLQACMPNCHK